MEVCAQQLMGSLMLTGGSAGVFIGIAYGNTIVLAVSPAFLLFGIFLSTLPIPSRRRVLLPTTL